MTSELIIAQLAVLTMTQQDDFLAGHAVELDVDSLAIVQFRVQDHWLNGDGEVEVDDLEGGVEDIAL